MPTKKRSSGIFFYKYWDGEIENLLNVFVLRKACSSYNYIESRPKFLLYTTHKRCFLIIVVIKLCLDYFWRNYRIVFVSIGSSFFEGVWQKRQLQAEKRLIISPMLKWIWIFTIGTLSVFMNSANFERWCNYGSSQCSQSSWVTVLYFVQH